MSSWKARLLMVLTILTMLLAMSAAPAMANGFDDDCDDLRDRLRDNLGFRTFDFADCDDDEGAEVVPLAAGECLAIVDLDHPRRSERICAPPDLAVV